MLPWAKSFSMSSQHNTKQMYIAAKVPLHKVIVFPQVRKTFHKTELQILADDIALHGVLQPSIVGKLSPEMFTKYKDTFQLISGVTLDPIESFHSIDESGKKWYYPLIAGERRYRAHKLLWDE